MTERLADIAARIEGMKDLGAVVNAMKGIAAARANGARTQVLAVDSYAATIAFAMSRILRPSAPGRTTSPGSGTRRPGLLVFCAEQGFAGAFSERVLDSLGQGPDPRPHPDRLFLVGTRGISLAAARGLAPGWSATLPSHTQGLPRLADRITRAIHGAVAAGRIDGLEAVFTVWTEARPSVRRQRIFPLDLADLPPTTGDRPLTQLPEDRLLAALGEDYLNALVCKAALHAFAAENQARMEAMSSAAAQITRALEGFHATLRRVRQEAITAEIIELGTGAAAPP